MAEQTGALIRMFMRSSGRLLHVQNAAQPERNPAPVPAPGRRTPGRVTPIRPLPAIQREPLLTAGQEPAPNAPRVLVVAPQPFYEDRGTPIATRQLMQAFSHLGYGVDLVTYPIGRSIDIPGVTYHRAANPLRIARVPIGFSMRKIALDAMLIGTLHERLRARRYAFIHAVEEAAFPAVVLGRRYGIPVVYDMQSSLPEQLMKHAPLRGAL
ncbi:MAG: glycosyltransferase, partial [Gemmatimonadaceae bacterium]